MIPSFAGMFAGMALVWLVYLALPQNRRPAMTTRANLKGVTAQQADLMCELDVREGAGRGAQTAWDFDGFRTTSPWSQRRLPISGSAARSSLERLVKRGLVERVGARPRTYRLTDEGRGAIGRV